MNAKRLRSINVICVLKNVLPMTKLMRHKTIHHAVISSQIWGRESAIIEKMIVIPVSSNCQEMEEMGLKRRRQKERKISMKSYKKGCSVDSWRTNRTGVRVSAGE